MRTHWLCYPVLVTALALTGCGGKVETPDLAPDNNARLGDWTEVDLNAWLKLPREDQAKLADEWTETIRVQLKAINDNPESVELLPKLLPPLTVPVFHEAKFSSAVGFSVPSYLDVTKKDAAVALHLARHGDHEAASKLMPEALRATLDSFKAERNYPVEWTRLAGLTLLSAQLKLAVGEIDGATQLVLVHRQLAKILDAKTRDGALGVALLTPGKRALARAALAWRDAKRAKPTLADDVDQAVREWTKVPAPTTVVPFAATSVEVSALFGSPVRGKAVIADKPASIARVLDLFGLPLSRDGVQVVAAFLDAKDQLAEWQIAYPAKIDTLYPSCTHLGYRLLETGYTGNDETKTANLARQSFTGGDVDCEVVRTDRSPALGGLIRIVPLKKGSSAIANRGFRDFGPVSLDRGFEASRMALAPAVTGVPLLVKDGPALKTMASVLETPPPDAIVLLRDSRENVLQMLEMSWPATENEHALDRLMPSLWDDFGPGKFEEVEDQAGAYLGFAWTDATTKILLRLAFDDRGPVLSVKDTQPADKLRQRVKLARERDQKDRLVRIAENQADVRLARSPGLVNDFSLSGLSLGQPKAQAESALPTGRSYRRKAVPEGVSVVALTTPDKTATVWARQLLVRYKDGKVSEIRVRYQAGPATPKKGESLLERLTDAKAGAAETLPGTWNGLWTDLGETGKIVYRRWVDDRTVRTYQQDEGGMEVVWRDRTAEDDGLEPRPWQFVLRGVPGCGIDDVRGTVEAALRAPVTTTAEGAVVYRLPASSPYEMVLVWYEGDRVSRLMAVHRDRPGAQPKDVAQALSQAWGRNVDTLGFICRQDGERGRSLGAYYWHDDRVRVQTFVRREDQGQRLLTEWRSWPIAADKAVARPETDE